MQEHSDMVDFVCPETKSTVLHWAVIANKKNVLVFFLKLIPEDKIVELLQHQDGCGKTVFHHVASREVLDLLKNYTVNWSNVLALKCKKEKTAFHYAIQNQNHSMLEHLLLEHNIDDLLVETDEDNQNCFHYFCNHFPDSRHFLDFVEKIDKDKCQSLATSPTKSTNSPPAFLAIDNDCADFLNHILKFLTIDDVLKTKFGKEGNTLIMHAVKHKNFAKFECVFRRLLELKVQNKEYFKTALWSSNDQNESVLDLIFNNIDKEALEKLLEIIPKERCIGILNKSKPFKPVDDIKSFEMVCMISGL